jgi:hypothetical protein
MKQSIIFRENAENCMRLAERAAKEQDCLRYRRMARAWTALANEQDWLDGEIVTANDNHQIILHGPNSQS